MDSDCDQQRRLDSECCWLFKYALHLPDNCENSMPKKSTRAKMSTECKLNNFLHVFTFYKNLVELLSIVCLLLKAFTMLLHDLLTDLARLNWIFVLNFIVSSRIRFDKEKRMKLGKKWQWRKWQKKSEWEK